jgi:cell wall-associated NlpC family hydrolase
MHRATQPLIHIALVCMLVMLTGCSTPGVPPAATSGGVPLAVKPGAAIAAQAIALVGKPYRYGGADLDGFDCSGLVYFIHHALGINVPRTAAQQQRAAASVARTQLQPGDLVFFDTTGRKQVSHVGIYVGDSRFVHAPQTGKLIELRSLTDSYYGSHLISSGRLHPDN